MSSRFRSAARALAVAAALAAASAAAADPNRALRVCADPNNLPFSNERGEGFENRLAEIVAADLGSHVEYTWWAQRRGFVRNTIGAGDCDVLMGVPRDLDSVLTTAPYYRSTYAFVYRKGSMPFKSFDDPALRDARVGVQLIGDDFANTPPAHALGRRGIVANVVGYPVYGDYTEPNPPARIVEAVAHNELDVAIVWGPLAGYFAARASAPLSVTPLAEQREGVLPFAFDISVGVARRAPALRDEIDGALAHRKPDIDRLLDEYHVPRVDRDE